MVKNSEIKLFFSWYFLEVPKFFVLLYKNIQKKTWYYFNILFLLKTILEPWKRDLVVPANPSIAYYVQAFSENLISRFMGLTIRFATIIAGLILIALMNILLLVAMIVWYLLLILLISSFVKGISGLIKG